MEQKWINVVCTRPKLLDTKFFIYRDRALKGQTWCAPLRHFPPNALVGGSNHPVRTPYAKGTLPYMRCNKRFSFKPSTPEFKLQCGHSFNYHDFSAVICLCDLCGFWSVEKKTLALYSSEMFTKSTQICRFCRRETPICDVMQHFALVACCVSVQSRYKKQLLSASELSDWC